MPYIRPDIRDRIHCGVSRPNNPGELNYEITKVIENYRHLLGDSYSTFNDIVGALALASSEFQRRVIAPYEDRKLQENGDVYAPLEDSHDDSTEGKQSA